MEDSFTLRRDQQSCRNVGITFFRKIKEIFSGCFFFFQAWGYQPLSQFPAGLKYTNLNSQKLLA